jgi:hypothetical protein
MPCRVAGCENTWTWYGHQQIRSLGKPAPKRMCDDHLAEFEGIDDRQMPCRNSWCTNTWLWPRFAQLRALEHEGKAKPPYRLCETCFNEERNTEDLAVRCKIPECRSTWTWPRQAQLKHRAWVRRQLAIEEADERGAEPVEARGDVAADEAGAEVEAHDEAAESSEPATEVEAEPHDEGSEVEAEAEAEARDESSEAHESEAHETEDAAHEHHADAEEGQPKRRRRKRKRRRKIHEGPPERLCDRCNERITHLQPIEIPCKVHGCHSTWTWDREGQLRAWATLDNQPHVTELPQPPRRMCTSCLEFVRKHSDREVRCGRPGCDKVWTYKTGAQLQDYLAGRTQDPIRLCEECIRSQFTISTSADGAVPPGSEIMPCQVSGCSGTWVYMPGMKLSSADPDASEPPVDRMCDDCRSQREVPARDPRRRRAEPSSLAVGETVTEQVTPDDETTTDDAIVEAVEPPESEAPESNQAD